MSYLRLLGAAVATTATAFAVIAIAPVTTSTVYAQETGDTEITTDQVQGDTSTSSDQAADDSATTAAPANNDPYSYVAQHGDSYTVLARKAVQTMGILDNVSLSQAQIIAAETMLTRDAGSPILNEGQAVSFSTDAVKAAVEAAQKLSPEQVASWEHYVKYVDFDTSDNGGK